MVGHRRGGLRVSLAAQLPKVSAESGGRARVQSLSDKADRLDLVIPLSRFGLAGLHVADQFRLFIREALYGIGWRKVACVLCYVRFQLPLLRTLRALMDSRDDRSADVFLAQGGNGS